jgi:hypothetical protein
MNRVTLLLNLAILVVNFALACGATETQVRVLRSTARTLATPSVPSRLGLRRLGPPPERRLGAVPLARFVKYLARLDGTQRLTPPQVAALYRALEDCAAELTRGGRRLRVVRDDGDHARRLVERLERRIAATLKAADVPEGETLARLVRVVMASAG